MFTGIVEELGTVVSFVDDTLRIQAATVLDDAEIGASIAVNGCCLTVTHFEPPRGEAPGWWEADVSIETLKRTNIGACEPGMPVHTGQVCVLGWLPNAVEQLQNSFDCVCNCTWTSKPMTIL